MGSKGEFMTTALVVLFVLGWVACTVLESANGSGRWRMLSGSALEVKVKDPSQDSLH